MHYLIATSILWGFSFGLIKAQMSELDPFVVSLVRLALSFAAFAPFVIRVPRGAAVRLAGIGFVQFGCMYCLYISSYRFLQGHQVAILTITTPLFVVLIDAIFARRSRIRYWLGAALAIAGAVVIAFDPKHDRTTPALVGVLLVQAANLCFAAGQLLYKRVKQQHGLGADHRHFAWLYLGALVVPAGAIAFEGLTSTVGAFPDRGAQWLSLAYLGLVPSGLGFFLWNRGVTLVTNGVAAVMNNLKVPAAVLVAWAIFSEPIETAKVAASLALLAAALVTVHERDAG